MSDVSVRKNATDVQGIAIPASALGQLAMNALPEAIRIAIGAPLSGSAAARGAEMKQAIELAVEEQNADGGIAGLPILLEAADDKGKVETGRQIADAFCDRPDLLGIVGHYNRNGTIAAAEIYAAHDLAMITPIASDPAHRVKAFLSCPLRPSHRLILDHIKRLRAR